MKKLRMIAVTLCVLAVSVAALAKDKEYEEGTLTDLVAAGKGWENNIAGGGRHRVYYYDFKVKLGDKDYVGRYDSKKNNVLKKGEWDIGSSVEVRFEKKSALIAHGTYMYIKVPDKNKEIRTLTHLGWGPHDKIKDDDSAEQ